jgi:outer membrane protein, multidrug efflux system
MRLRALLGAALVMGGCTLGPDYKRPAVEMPAAFRGAPPAEPKAETLADIRWWQLFQDEMLQGLIRTALRENYDVQIAAARILDARAQVTITRSFQFPSIEARGDTSYTHVEGERIPLQSEDAWPATAGFLFGFELDFWGRFRRATESARAELLASEAAQRFVLTSLVSDVATAYFTLRALDLELDISRRTLGTRLDSVRLVQLRAQGGVAALIDVHQAEILVAQAATTIADTERLIEQTENALGVLLGRSPDAVPRGRSLDDQFAAAAPTVPVGLPSALLERRPDIQQAEAQLHAATARIGVAKTDYFPRVFLSASAAAGGFKLDGTSIGPQGVFSVGPSVTFPIFNTGRVGAGIESAEARTQAALAQYRQVIIQAFREVADGLVEYRKRQEARVQQQALAVASQSTTRLANIRYRGGVTGYLEVLDSERQLFDAELGLARSRRDELLAVVRIYRALGGGWQE